MIDFTVPGAPQGKGRPRATTVQGKARLFTPDKTVAYESLVALFGAQAMAGRPLLAGAVRVRVVATFPIAKSWPKARREAAETGKAPHTSKPDADNIMKAVADGLNGVCWVDDSQISESCIRKTYGTEPRLDIFVEPLSE